MKKSAYRIVTSGSHGTLEVEIMVDINRELTRKDNENLQIYSERIVSSLLEETINLDPKSKEEAKEEKDSLINLFGNNKIFVQEIPNEYCSQYCCKHLPWFLITTNKGLIKIGWRKRVISIEWTKSIIKETSQELFPDEDVTKYDKVIHAWGYGKAKEYIDVLLK